VHHSKIDLVKAEKGQVMTAFNAVRFKVKAGREQQFLDAHNKVGPEVGLAPKTSASRRAIGPR
jgi:hypothetical protein